jgi:hypothetical protein
MDISVSRLNKRMALQLPAEFPLGLVFVVGRVRDVKNVDRKGGPPYFYISERGYMLRCQLSERALDGITLNEGDLVRAGGHLAFDTLQADYFLLARDIEVLPEHRASRPMMAPILADIKKRSLAASLAPAELPDWVQQIAPPEIREAQKMAEQDDDSEEDDLEDTAEPPTVIEPQSEPVETAAPESQLPAGFTDDLVTFLSEAMDSPEDVEITQEMVTDLAPAISSKQGPPVVVKPYDVPASQPETRVPWAIVFVVVFFLISFLGLILVLAIFAAR